MYNQAGKELAMLYDIKMESMPREELKALQLKRLQDVANRVYYNVPFYHKRFDELGVKPTDIRSLDDIRRLPFTTKQDLRDRYPLGFMAVPRENIARLHASSGTTGQAVVGCYTKRDLKNWAQMGCRCLMASGVTPQDLVHVAYGYGLFTGGLGLHDAATELGCTVVPASVRLSSSATSAPRFWPARLPTLSIFMKSALRTASTSRSCPCAWAFSAVSPGPRPCARKWKRIWGLIPITSTAFPKSWDPAWPLTAANTTVCISGRTTSLPKS